MRDFEEDFEFELATATVNRTRDFRSDDAFVGNPFGCDRPFDPAREAMILAHQKRIQSYYRKLNA